MITFDYSDLQRMVGNIEGYERQIPFACAYALTNAMRDTREAEVASMRSVFSNPTPYTLNALRVVPATKNKLRAEMHFKEFGGTPAWKYLGPQVRGGVRKHKGFERALIRAGIMRSGEFAVPGRGMKLNGYGNMSGGQVTQILSALGANPDALSNTRRRPKRSNRKRNLDYFVVRGGQAKPGVYRRVGKQAVPMLLFVSSVSYRPRLPYYQTIRSHFGPAFRKHFRAGWQRFVLNDPRRRKAA